MKNSERKISSSRQISFQALGVKIGIRAGKAVYLKEAIKHLERTFPGGLDLIEKAAVEYLFVIKESNQDGLKLYRNQECVSGGVFNKDIFFDLLESQVRLTVAEFAVEKVVLHAGVVAWKGKAIVIPAKSFSGKSTLVAALIKKGALYYSDEYAVIDAEGNVQPFPKWLSLRGIIDDFRQLDCSPESLGGTIGKATVPVGMILLSKYDKQKKAPVRWQPKRLSCGQGIMEILPHTLPVRNNPKFVLEVLNKLTTRAIIVKTVRGDAEEFAGILLKYFEQQSNKTLKTD